MSRIDVAGAATVGAVRVKGVVRAAACVLVVACAAVLSGAVALVAVGPAVAGVPVVPVGWNSWNAFGCDIDQARIEAAAQAIVNMGMRDAGYRTVTVDDCWVAPHRDKAGRLRADPMRFPSGMAALGSFLHARGLRFGLYTSATTETCAQRTGAWPGATGSEGHEALDAATFAAWGVDLVKDDWCAGAMTPGRQRAIFTAFRDGIRATGRPITLSINPNSGIASGVPGADEDWAGIATTVRITNDVVDRWRTGQRSTGEQGVAEQIAAAESSISATWSRVIRQDADMLQVGNSALTAEEQRSELGMLAELGMPLVVSTDPANDSSATTHALLTDARLTALATDPTGRPQRLPDRSGAHVWLRATMNGPVVAVFNPTSVPVRVALRDLLPVTPIDLWTGHGVSTVVLVAPHDTALLAAH